MPTDPSAQALAEVSPREMMIEQAFLPLSPEDFDMLASDGPLKVGLPLSRWYVHTGNMPDGTPRFVFARITPARVDIQAAGCSAGSAMIQRCDGTRRPVGTLTSNSIRNPQMGETVKTKWSILDGQILFEL